MKTLNAWTAVLLLVLLVLAGAMGLSNLAVAHTGSPAPPTPWLMAHTGSPAPPTPWHTGSPAPPTPWHTGSPAPPTPWVR